MFDCLIINKTFEPIRWKQYSFALNKLHQYRYMKKKYVYRNKGIKEREKKITHITEIKQISQPVANQWFDLQNVGLK